MTKESKTLPPTRVHPDRLRRMKDGSCGRGPVVYWMSREQRAQDNWALLYAQDLAMGQDRPLMVCFCLTPTFLGAGRRQYDFMLAGLRETEEGLAAKRIPFVLRVGDPPVEVHKLLCAEDAAAVVVDFDPLRIKQAWQKKLTLESSLPIWEVDAHNIVPCRTVSPRQEFAARTLRPKLHKRLDDFLTPMPRLRRQERKDVPRSEPGDWAGAAGALKVDRSVDAVTWLRPGYRAGRRVLNDFVDNNLAAYDEAARDPNAGGLSNLSPYLHFGQLAAQHVALCVRDAEAPQEAKDAFLEELIVRRELSDNFCLYNPDYDSLKCAPEWARRTLEEHRGDVRPVLYDSATLEAAATEDPVWNAAQREMVRRGKMHGYMRMYWAKKILEWSPDPETALATVIALNDRYELDGRDPNGYAGAAWSICGVHDRAWSERPIFGKIRYMSAAGCRRKFDMEEYIRRQNA